MRKKFQVKTFIKLTRGEDMKVQRCCIMFNKAHWWQSGEKGGWGTGKNGMFLNEKHGMEKKRGEEYIREADA